MVDYSSIRASVELIVGEHVFLLNEFEKSVRDIVSSDVQAVFTNSVSSSTIQNSINSSLQHISSLALEHSSNDSSLASIAVQLWNPLVASLSELRVRDTPPRQAQRVRSKEKSKPVKPSLTPLSSNVDASDVRKQVKLVLSDREFLYKNEAHRHIKCTTPRCTFCEKVFKTVNLTKCDGHRPCHSSGFYPHIGSALWNMLKTRHDKGQRCTIPTKAPGSHEIRAISDERPPSSIASDSSCDTLKDARSSSKRRRTPSPPSETSSRGSYSYSTRSERLDWAQDVESEWHCRKAASVPRDV